MRVQFILNTFAPTYCGGAEISLYHTCRGLMRSGIDCASLVVNNTRKSVLGEEFYEYEGLSIHWPRTRTKPRRRWSDVFDLDIYRVVAAELRRVKPDIVHVHNISGASLAPFVACKQAGVPVVQTLHDFGMLCPNNMRYRYDGAYCDPGVYRQPCHRCFRRYDYWADVPLRTSIFAVLTSNVKFFVSPSCALASQYIRAGYDKRRFRVIPYGIGPWIEQASDDPRLRELVRGGGNRPTLLFAAGGIETKGAGTILNALPVMIRHIEGLRLIVTGGGEAQFLELFRRSGAEVIGNVAFGQMPSVFATADLTLVPSIWFDNSPMVIAESMRFGTPVVGSHIGGIPELIRDNQTGYLIPPGDAASLAERVIFHFSRPPLERRQMRRDCVVASHSQSSIECHVDTLSRLYAEALEV